MTHLLLRNPQSPGDIVMLTAAVRELHRAFPGEYQTWVETRCPELWFHNPYLTKLDAADPVVRVIDCHYPAINHSNRVPKHFLWGFVQHLGEQLGVRLEPTEFRGDIHLSEKETRTIPQVMEATGADLPYWIIGAGGKYDYTIKWWATERWQAVVDAFKGRIVFVQVGESGHHHPALQNVIDLRGRTTLRQLVRLVHHAAGVLCPVTCLMHLAAAVPVRSGRPKKRACVVVAGGREPVGWVEYPQHRFLHTGGALRCCDNGGCWKARTVPLGDGDEKDAPSRLCVQPVIARDEGTTDCTDGHGFSNKASEKSVSSVVPNSAFESMPPSSSTMLPRCMDMITAADVVRAVGSYYEGGALEFISAEQWERAITAGVDYTAKTPTLPPRPAQRPSQPTKKRCTAAGCC